MKSIPTIHPAITENTENACACETRAPKINYWNTHKPARFVLSHVLSVTQYKQRTVWKASLQSIQPSRKIRTRENARPISQYVKAIMPQFQQCWTRLVSRSQTTFLLLYWVGKKRVWWTQYSYFVLAIPNFWGFSSLHGFWLGQAKLIIRFPFPPTYFF